MTPAARAVGVATGLAYLAPAARAWKDGRLALACTVAAQSACGAAVSARLAPEEGWLRADRALMAWHAGAWAAAPAARAEVAAAFCCKAAQYAGCGPEALLSAVWRVLLLLAAYDYLAKR